MRIFHEKGGRLGFGAMHLPTAPAGARSNAIAVARRAVELGVTVIDTAHLYGWGANEELLAEALYPYAEGLLIATKVGVAPPGPGREAAVCGRPELLRDQVEQALRRLRVDRLELLQLHRIDPEVPLADQLGTLRDLQSAGKIGHLGLSEVTVAELAQAQALIDVVSVQNRYNILDREHEAVLDACTDQGIAFLPWRPVHPAVHAAGEVGAVAAELGHRPRRRHRAGGRPRRPHRASAGPPHRAPGRCHPVAGPAARPRPRGHPGHGAADPGGEHRGRSGARR